MTMPLLRTRATTTTRIMRAAFMRRLMLTRQTLRTTTTARLRKYRASTSFTSTLLASAHRLLSACESAVTRHRLSAPHRTALPVPQASAQSTGSTRQSYGSSHSSLSSLSMANKRPSRVSPTLSSQVAVALPGHGYENDRTRARWTSSSRAARQRTSDATRNDSRRSGRSLAGRAPTRSLSPRS